MRRTPSKPPPLRLVPIGPPEPKVRWDFLLLASLALWLMLHAPLG